jgi:hypothetical protein
MISNRLRMAAAICVAGAVALWSAPAALAFAESYGPATVGNNGYIQSGGAHTFKQNEGAGSNGGRLACQLFNYGGGANEVSHGNGYCLVFYGGGQFVWARVYNESGVTETIEGYAST